MLNKDDKIDKQEERGGNGNKRRDPQTPLRRNYRKDPNFSQPRLNDF